MHQKIRQASVVIREYPDRERYPDGFGMRMEVSADDARRMVASLTERSRSNIHELVKRFGCVILLTEEPVELRPHKTGPHVLHSMHARTPGGGSTAWHRDQADYLALRACKNFPDNPVGMTGIAGARMVENAIDARVDEMTSFVERLPSVTEERRRYVLHRLREVTRKSPSAGGTGKLLSDPLWQATQQLPSEDRGTMQQPLTEALKQRGALYEHRWDGHSILLVDDNAVLHCNLSTGVDEAPSDMERLKIRL